MRSLSAATAFVHKLNGTKRRNNAVNAALVGFTSSILRYGAESFFKMFAASLGALRIEAAMLPASSPGTKRGGDPWLLVHSAKKAWSLPIV
jgi:hypothetical protein